MGIELCAEILAIIADEVIELLVDVMQLVLEFSDHVPQRVGGGLLKGIAFHALLKQGALKIIAHNPFGC